MREGWIVLDRQLLTHWLWDSEREPFSSGQAWIDMLLTAQYADSKLKDRYGNLTTIPRGSFVTSIRMLTERWHWGKDRVRHFLGTLQDDGMITVRSDARGTLITIINYDNFQTKNISTKTDTQKKTMRTCSRDAQKGMRTCSRDAHKDAYKDADPPLKKNINKDKENNSPAPPSSEEPYDPFSGRKSDYYGY